ncbi:hypothetical protein K525DRAFT_261644 [Schizophyllum commune Loenen D]|nr:hypothetical protein K525DRAFT_261644 [Schizophyllum commune Loenen D]
MGRAATDISAFLAVGRASSSSLCDASLSWRNAAAGTSMTQPPAPALNPLKLAIAQTFRAQALWRARVRSIRPRAVAGA